MKCHHCGSHRILPKQRKIRRNDVAQVYKCKACGSMQTVRDRILPHMQFPLFVMLYAIHHYKPHPTFKEIMQELASFGYKVSDQALYRWVKEKQRFLQIPLPNDQARILKKMLAKHQETT